MHIVLEGVRQVDQRFGAAIGLRGSLIGHLDALADHFDALGDVGAGDALLAQCSGDGIDCRAYLGRRPIQAQVGATHTLMRPYGDDWWVTVMGDVPAPTLQMFYQALDRKR